MAIHLLEIDQNDVATNIYQRAADCWNVPVSNMRGPNAKYAVCDLTVLCLYEDGHRSSTFY